MLFLHSPVEGQDGCGIVRHPMIRPGREVEVSHLQSSFRAAEKLQQKIHKDVGITYQLIAESYIPLHSVFEWYSLPVSVAQ